MKKKWIRQALAFALAVALAVGDSGVALATELSDVRTEEEPATSDEYETIIIDDADISDAPEAAAGSAAEETADSSTTETVDSNADTDETKSGEESDSEDAESEQTESPAENTSADPGDSCEDPEAESSADGEVSPVSFTAEAGEITVTVSGSVEALADVSGISVTDLGEDRTSEYKDALSESDAYTGAEVVSVYDITLLNVEGAAVEPTGEVTVIFTAASLIEGLRENEVLSILHNVDTVLQEVSAEAVSDEIDTLPEVKAESLEAMEVELAEEDGTLRFTSDMFSEYALVLTGNDSQIESEVTEDAYMEFDKYLVRGEDSINNQSTYDIYMETAYYDSSKPTVKTAPTRRDVIIIMDQSLTMGIGTRIEDTNSATAAFFKNAAAINSEFLEKARNGEYSDIDPSGDVEAQMQEHLIHVVGIMGYNNNDIKVMYRNGWDGLAPTSDSDVDTLTNAAYFDASRILEGTYTDVALAYAQDYWIYTSRAESTDIILITDGGATDMTHANNALRTAREIKDAGTSIYGVYVNYGHCDELTTALLNGDIDDVPAETDTELWKIYSEHMVSAVFLSLCSSDYPKNGTLGVNGKYYNYTYSYENDARNRFGQYSFFTDDSSGLIAAVRGIPRLIEGEAKNAASGGGYADATSYFIEEVTDPFEITDSSAIKIYQVPRIPANLDENGVPVDMDKDGVVTEFRWGERTAYTYDNQGNMLTSYSEWEDITEQVSCMVIGNTLKISGYDYEENAVTNYDKDCCKYWQSMSTEEDRKYEAGDYGYKLVLIVGINARITFGGNGIATNNSNTTAFYPSIPGDPDLPVWEENSDKNPDRNRYIEKYPVPTVDLTVTYAVNSDNMLIYAPQTAELLNLVTDTKGRLWYTDPSYDTLKSENDSAYDAYQDAIEVFQTAKKAAAENDSDESLQKAAEEAESALYKAKSAYIEANDALSAVADYTPDGINNAFVDIRYTLTDPDGNVVGTLTVPHGTEYYLDDSGEPNLKWSFTQQNITVSGEYTITCTVTPVNTTRSPVGHVYVTSDDPETKALYPYVSTEYSSTGSTAAGSQDALEIRETPTAHIFQLEVTATDTRLEKGQALDFNEGSEALLTGENPHIVSYRWVCTDGVTESVSANEPGITGLLKVGGGVTVSSQIPEAADAADDTVEDALVKIISGTKVTNAGNGEWVPVAVILSRMTGNLNKSASNSEQVAQKSVYMTDSDKLYGEELSSVIWNHTCEIITSHDCNEEDFAEAQAIYSTAEDATGRGTVRYLIHVEANPIPKIAKSTDTETITMGDDIQWNILVSNNDEASNPDQNASDFSMVDVLPYVGDERLDQTTSHDGSLFSGDLYYVSVSLDSGDSANTLAWLESGKAGMYYTTDTAVRTADEQQVLGGAGSGNIAWTAAAATIDGTEVTFSLPTNAVAIKFTTRLLWQESLRFSLRTNIVDLTAQQVGDYYHNLAYVTNGNGVSNSEVVVTTVIDLYIQGTVWEDADADGLLLNDEQGVSNVIVTLYRLYDENNGGDPSRVIDDVKLVRAFEKEGDMFSQIRTDSTGEYDFRGVTSGTYYLVFDQIPDQYEVTAKQAGADDAASAKLDSEAEESYLTDQDELLARSAWIKEIALTREAAENQNLGLKNILGTITVRKTLDEIYFPTTMTEEEREEYMLTFAMQLTSAETGRVYSGNVVIDDSNKGTADVSCTFTDLPLGEYNLTEAETALYNLQKIRCDSQNVAFDISSGVVSVNITAAESELEIIAYNGIGIPVGGDPDDPEPNTPPPGGDGPNGAANWINMRIPVSLTLIYAGEETISSDSLTTYTFTESDFSPALGGDIIVTYDDASTISLSAGTLDFDDITLSPAAVSNTMNSAEPLVITGYYSEKGRTLKDTFRVTADLKPIHKFQLNFDANGSRFSNGATRNAMMFGYDEEADANYVTSGTYKDVDNGGLNDMGDGYVFAGWNTKDDGTGIQYDSYTALNAIGANTGIDSLTLYANWKVYVTFDANGNGDKNTVITGGITDAELVLAAAEVEVGSLLYNRNQVMATTLEGSRTYYRYVFWNTAPDGTGVNLEDYGKITEPVTFYAIYYQSDYIYKGSYYTFTAPISGTYSIALWGASGGTWNANYRGKGGYTYGEIYLEAGTELYVYVGGQGSSSGGGWNGGGRCLNDDASVGYGGGGATDVRIVAGAWNNSQSLASRIMVAGAGGGSDNCAENGKGGHGGGLSGTAGSGEDAGSAGTQIRGTLGQGASGRCNDGGGGGSSYISGYYINADSWEEASTANRCAISYTGYVFDVDTAETIAGNKTMPTPTGGYSTGNTGHGYAQILLTSK